MSKRTSLYSEIWEQISKQTGVGIFCWYADSHYQDKSALWDLFTFLYLRQTICWTPGAFPPSLKKKKSHSCIYGSVINLADRCLLRRYKQPNNRVCLGCDDSRCAVQKKTQQVFTKNESEWNQQFTALYSAAAADRQRGEILVFLSCFVSAAQLRPVEKVPPGLTLPSWCHAHASPFSPG